MFDNLTHGLGVPVVLLGLRALRRFVRDREINVRLWKNFEIPGDFENVMIYDSFKFGFEIIQRGEKNQHGLNHWLKSVIFRAEIRF